MTSGENLTAKLRLGIYYQEKANRKDKNMEKEKINILQEDQDGVYADNGVYYSWQEIEIDDNNPEVAYIKPLPEPRLIKFKCKPTYNFQSIEFEIEVSEDYLEPMFTLYRKVVEGLIKVTPDQPKNGVVANPASPKQIEIMDKFRIPYQPGITYDQADAKIKESYAKSKSRTY